MKELFHLHLSKLGCFKKNRIVSRRVMLVALLSLLTLPIFAETSNSIGVFFVSKTKVVSFAPGNLQYDKKTSTYSFASEQYAMLGVYNVTGGKITTDGAGQGKENKTGTDLAENIDLFGWSSTESNPRNNYGVSVADIDSYYAGEFLDWGNNVINGDDPNTWRTLTYDEWEYLRYKRPNADNLIAIARIDFARQELYNGDAYMNGLILLPDNWEEVKPIGLDVKRGGFQDKNSAGIAHENNFAYQVISTENWNKLASAGAVFLPAAGTRLHGAVKPNGVKPVTGINNTRHTGHYWTAKPRENGKAGVFEFNSSAAQLSPQIRWGGRAVRLTQDTLPVKVTLPIDKVTSSAGQTVKVRIPITLSSLFGMNGNSPTTITGESSNDAFEVMPLKNVGPGNHELIVHYTPTATNDGLETATITLTSTTLQGSTSFKMTGRHLAKNFVIATKVGNEWVALTADMSGDGIQRALPIVVDNNTTPTKATFAFDYCQYQLLDLNPYRFTKNGTAVHLYSSKKGSVLQASPDSNTKKGLYAEHGNIYAQLWKDSLFCEWHLVSQDLVHYTIINSNESSGWENHRILGYCSNDDAWGMYYKNPEDTKIKIYQDIFLLPVEKALADNMEVMEWGTESMIVRFKDGRALPKSLTIHLAGQSTTHDIFILNGSDLGRIDNNLTGNNCTTMAINTNSTNGTILRTPIIVSSGTDVLVDALKQDYDHCHLCDIVILTDATLTSSCDFINFANIHVYPGGKLYFKERADQLGAINKVYLRGGYSWLNQDTYALPEIYLNDSIYFKGSNNIYYDYYIKLNKYYQFALPYTVSLGSVTDEANCDDFPVWVKHYNGALRAANAHATSWEYYEGTMFYRGIGYAIAAKPRQVERVKNRPLSIIRFRLGNEEFEKPILLPLSVTTKAHGIDGYKAGTVTANNVGWNFVGNPFLSPWKGDIGHDQLEKNIVDDKWDGSYKWVNSDFKYITIMSPENGYYYRQYIAKDTKLMPFFPFFMQETATGGTGKINFATANLVQKAPAELYAHQPETYVQIEILAEGVEDQTGVFAADKYSDEIDFDDYEKIFGSSTDKAKIWLVHQDRRMAFEAMTETTAASPIALGYRAPQTGHYTFAINEEVSELEDVLAVYLTDHLAGVVDHDLLDEVYEFESESAIYNDNRFTVRVVLRNEAPGTTTDIEDIIGVHPAESPCKFIYQNRMYIMRNGILYDATGLPVSTIDK